MPESTYAAGSRWYFRWLDWLLLNKRALACGQRDWGARRIARWPHPTLWQVRSHNEQGYSSRLTHLEAPTSLDRGDFSVDLTDFSSINGPLRAVAFISPESTHAARSRWYFRWIDLLFLNKRALAFGQRDWGARWIARWPLPTFWQVRSCNEQGSSSRLSHLNWKHPPIFILDRTDTNRPSEIPPYWTFLLGEHQKFSLESSMRLAIY